MVELISSLWGDWVWFAAAALGLVSVLIAIVYALSDLLMNDKMKTWAKMELAELFYSAVIIVIGLAGVTTIDSVLQGAIGVGSASAGQFQCMGTATSAYVPVSVNGQMQYECLDICGATIASDPQSVYYGISSCHMRLGIWYMEETFNEAKGFAYNMYISYIKSSIMSEFTINIEYFTEYAGFFTFNPWRGFFTMGNNVKQLCFDWGMKIMMLTKFQEVVLRYIAVALFPALFVIGAILRTFTFTRRLGGLLLAMAIALYFIFPAFYAFGALVMLDLKSQAYSAWMQNDKANPVHLVGPLAGKRIPDPPIANTMYINDSIPVIGGASVSTQTLQDDLSNDEAQGNAFIGEMGAGKDLNNNVLMPSFDLSSTKTHTDAETTSAMTTAYNTVVAFKDTMSKEGKSDSFVKSAWSPNGPLDVLARITFWSVFFALFGLIGTIGVIRSLSITFGGDIEIAGLTRLI